MVVGSLTPEICLPYLIMHKVSSFLTIEETVSLLIRFKRPWVLPTRQGIKPISCFLPYLKTANASLL